MPSVTRWEMPCGAVVIKYRMAGKMCYLRYELGQSLDGGDYTRHDKLKQARELIHDDVRA